MEVSRVGMETADAMWSASSRTREARTKAKRDGAPPRRRLLVQLRLLRDRHMLCLLIMQRESAMAILPFELGAATEEHSQHAMNDCASAGGSGGSGGGLRVLASCPRASTRSKSSDLQAGGRGINVAYRRSYVRRTRLAKKNTCADFEDTDEHAPIVVSDPFIEIRTCVAISDAYIEYSAPFIVLDCHHYNLRLGCRYPIVTPTQRRSLPNIGRASKCSRGRHQESLPIPCTTDAPR